MISADFTWKKLGCHKKEKIHWKVSFYDCVTHSNETRFSICLLALNAVISYQNWKQCAKYMWSWQVCTTMQYCRKYFKVYSGLKIMFKLWIYIYTWNCFSIRDISLLYHTCTMFNSNSQRQQSMNIFTF